MLAFFILLLLVALALQYDTLRRGFEGVEHRADPTADTVEPDEVFDIITELSNGTRRFLPFIGLHEAVPLELEIHTEGIKTRVGGQGLRYMMSTAYLMPRQRLLRRVTASLPARGRYFLRGATLQMGDFLGLQEATEYFSRFSEIVVIPRPLQSPKAMETLGGFLGDVSVNRFIFEDPVLTLGFREYTMREPMKHISWTQTARWGQMMVKNFDHTLELTVTVLLNVQCEGENAHTLVERCFSLSRTVCEELEGRGIQYDFITNASAAGALSLWSRVGEGLGARHLMTILEGLGRATYAHTEAFGDIMHRLAARAQQGRCFVIITPRDLSDCVRELTRLRDLTGGQICILSAEEVA